MKFEIDTDNKVITLIEEVNLTDLLSWIRATVGVQGWRIEDKRPINVKRKSPIIDIKLE